MVIQLPVVVVTTELADVDATVSSSRELAAFPRRNDEPAARDAGTAAAIVNDVLPAVDADVTVAATAPAAYGPVA